MPRIFQKHEHFSINTNTFSNIFWKHNFVWKHKHFSFWIWVHFFKNRNISEFRFFFGKLEHPWNSQKYHNLWTIYWIGEQIWKTGTFSKIPRFFEYVNKIEKCESFLNLQTNFENRNFFRILWTNLEAGSLSKIPRFFWICEQNWKMWKFSEFANKFWKWEHITNFGNNFWKMWTFF